MAIPLVAAGLTKAALPAPAAPLPPMAMEFAAPAAVNVPTAVEKGPAPPMPELKPRLVAPTTVKKVPALEPMAVVKSPRASAPVPNAALFKPVANEPKLTAVALLPEALASQFALLSKSVLATLPELHPACAR